MRTLLSWMPLDNPVLMALYATLFTWFMTALGSAMVFFFREIKPKVLNAMLGFASGVMISASFFSLINPALELSVANGGTPWLEAAVGFLAGAGFLMLADKIVPHLHFEKDAKPEGIHTNWKRSVLLVFSITLHNIPEGLAVGVAFGSLANGASTEAALAAMIVAIGIGIQNFPEGAAVSIPLRREGMSRWEAFMKGQWSGVVEPIAAVFGAWLVSYVKPLLPYALTFAAGAMIYVVTEELIPESQSGDHEATHFSTLGCILGFVIMMVLDVALG